MPHDKQADKHAEKADKKTVREFVKRQPPETAKRLREVLRTKGLLDKDDG
jgi:hypothetical protein